MDTQQTPPEPVHEPGSMRGEEAARKLGVEPGRQETTTQEGRRIGTSTPRFATGINPDDRKPIDPRSPFLPPA
jgi:hypothetical protein